MNLSQWHMNKMGLVDFWCYENEELQFEDGHMLLRGSNGSGKSVTLQSFIPLLLDGNKSSERLDTFGTRSRKMDTYLIDENSDLEERIGYLYLEFKREDSEIYKTIGMGMKARKNKPMQSWYFVIEDNRRVNVDFSLMENQLTLSKKQLENILGDQVISSQGEYSKRVNQALFGFESMDDFNDAISLLLQLRSPKLSNSLTPKKINEILGKSLQPLSDEELRPMSEAITNMDSLQDQLESLKQSLEAAKKLEHVYHTYNQAILLEKWYKFSNENNLLKEIEQSIANKEQQKQDTNQIIITLKQQHQDHLIEIEVKNNELNALKNSDIDKWLNDIDQYQKAINEYHQELSKKTTTQENKDDAYINACNQLKKHQDNISTLQRSCKTILAKMDFLDENLSLVEHIAVKSCFDTNKVDFDFSYTRQMLKAEITKINQGLTKWEEYEQQKSLLDVFNQKQEEIQFEMDSKAGLLTKAENQYRITVEEYLEKYHQYHQNNQLIKFSNDEMELLREYLIDYENKQDYFIIRDIIDHVKQVKLDELNSENYRLTNQINLVDEKLSDLNNELEMFTNQKDLEPAKTIEQVNNRNYLETHNIDYIPLYKLLDFDENINEEQKNRIEELLASMNLLDALIINQKDELIVKEAPGDAKDYYLWTTSNVDTLSPVMISELSNEGHLIDIFNQLKILEATQFIISDKYFKSGIIEGSFALNKKAVYIGYEHRMKVKLAKINELNQLIDEQIKLKEDLINQKQTIQQQLELLNTEYTNFISEKELKSKLDDVVSSRQELNKIQQELNQVIQTINTKNKALQDIYQQLQIIASNISLPVDKSAFLTKRGDLEEYQGYFEEFKDDYLKMLKDMELETIEQDNVERLQIDLDELNYEIETYRNKLKLAQDNKAMLQKQLDDAGYQDLSKRIELLKEQLINLNNKTQQLNNQIIIQKETINHLDEQLAQEIIKQNEQNKKTQIYKDILLQEVQFEFVIKNSNDENMLYKQLKNLTSNFGIRKNISDYQNQLQRVYFEQNTYLSLYNVVQENVDLIHEVDDLPKRINLKSTNQGKRIPFLELIKILNQNIEMQELLIVDEDRHIFEEILVNTIGKKIRERIQMSRRWVEKMQDYMNGLDISSGLQLSLKWKSRKALEDQQLDTQHLVELLEKDYQVLKEIDRQKISNHFRSKIKMARKLSLDDNTTASFHQLMKEVMDYREWFDFTLYAKKPNEKKRELTTNVFNSYSGGEKAISMYVPLFSAVAAKFASANQDAPVLIALDEAFAGVDENNIDNMFELITKFGFDYIMNSQALWGDYPSCPSLAIYELFRPNNAPFVTVVAYTWNGHVRKVKLS